MNVCRVCGGPIHSSNKWGVCKRNPYCRKIREQEHRQRRSREANREHLQEINRRYYHGMRPEDWATIWAAQDGKCYLCGDDLITEKQAHVDHDHSCCPDGRSCAACRRGLACRHCNALIGFARDDPDRLRRIADNLESVLLVTRERIAARPQQLRLDDAG